MRIVLIGERRLGEKALEALAEKGENIVGVYTTPDLPGVTNRLKNVATRLNIPVFPLKDVRSREFYDRYVKLEPELNVLPLLTTVLPVSILNYPRLGTICLHPSLLPKYGGLTPICWPIINGETETGVTIFWPDAGIDTGHILMQKKVDISPDDTQRTLYQDKIIPLGIDMLLESIDLIRQGKAPKIPQDKTQFSYYPPCTEEDATINWVQPRKRIFNLIRGTYPSPGATTNLGDMKFKVIDSEPLAGFVHGKPGEIVEVTRAGAKIAVPDGTILIKTIELANGDKITGADLAEKAGLKAGDRLGRRSIKL